MFFAGCDIGSLTAKAVIMDENSIIGSEIIRVRPNARESADEVLGKLLSCHNMDFSDIECMCTTGYGRQEIPYSDMNMSEISCHGMGAFTADKSIRTVVDIGGQDCKVISIDSNGRIIDFIMNDKCAAGTGKSLEMLARTLDVPLEELGNLSLKSGKPLNITNKCSVFMELEILDSLYRKKRLKDIVCGLSDAVAKRVASLARAVDIRQEVCITGGVSKNQGVVKQLEKRMNVRFKKIGIDPQITGALGAAVFSREKLFADKKNGEE